MNFAHAHLLLNHIPVLGSVFGFAMLSAALLRKSDELLKAGFATLILTAVAALAAFFTGEPAEHFIEAIPGISESFIERHEEAALASLVSAAITGALSLAGLFFFSRGRPLPRWLVPLSLLAALITLGLMARTANLGGQIRHEEARGSFGPS